MIAHEMSIFNDIRTEILNYQKKGKPKETNLNEYIKNKTKHCDRNIRK